MKDFVQLKSLKEIDIIEIKQFLSKERDRPDFQDKYLKILYFICIEGILSTLRKYLVHSEPQKKYLTFLFVCINQIKYVNISIQFNQDPDTFVINNKFYICPNINFESISDKLYYYLDQFNQFAGIENYKLFNIDLSNPFSYEIISQNYIEKYDQGLFIYGLGGYVKIFVIHHFKKISKIACVDYKANEIEYFKTKYGFKYGFVLASNTFPLIENVKQPIVIIATFHSDHASIRINYEYKLIESENSIEIKCHYKVVCEFIFRIIKQDYYAKYDLRNKSIKKI